MVRCSNHGRWRIFSFSFRESIDRQWAPPSFVLDFYWSSSTAVKQPVSEVNLPKLPCTEIKNDRSHISASPIFLHGVDTLSYACTCVRYLHLEVPKRTRRKIDSFETSGNSNQWHIIVCHGTWTLSTTLWKSQIFNIASQSFTQSAYHLNT